MYHNIGKHLAENVATLPNMCMQIAWDVSLELQAGQSFIQFDRPWLIWNKTVNFKKDHIPELHRLVMGVGLPIPRELANSGLHSFVMGTGYG